MKTKRILPFGLALLLVAGVALVLALFDKALKPSKAETMEQRQKSPVGTNKKELRIVSRPTEASDSVTPVIEKPSGYAVSGLTREQENALGRLDILLDRGGKAVDQALDPLRDWARRNPAECARWVLEHLEGPAGQRSLEEVLAVWSEQSPLAALNWLDQQVNVDGLEGAYSNTLTTMARNNAAAAVEWLRGHPSQASLENWENVLGAWGEVNSTDASRWFKGNLDSNLKDALLPNLLASFHSADSTAMLLQGNSASVNDAALSQAAKASSVTSPDFAMGLAGQIQDETARRSSQEKVLTQWVNSNPAEARSYAASHGLRVPAMTSQDGNSLKAQPIQTTIVDTPPALPQE